MILKRKGSPLPRTVSHKNRSSRNASSTIIRLCALLFLSTLGIITFTISRSVDENKCAASLSKEYFRPKSGVRILLLGPGVANHVYFQTMLERLTGLKTLSASKDRIFCLNKPCASPESAIATVVDTDYFKDQDMTVEKLAVIALPPHESVYNEALLTNIASVETPSMKIQSKFAKFHINRYKYISQALLKYTAQVFHASDLMDDAEEGGSLGYWMRLVKWLDNSFDEYRLRSRMQCVFEENSLGREGLVNIVPSILYGGKMNKSTFSEAAWNIVSRRLSQEACVLNFTTCQPQANL